MIRTASLLLLVVLASCSTTTIDNDGGALTPTVERIVTRHDGWVMADPSLVPALRDNFLAQSKTLATAFRGKEIEVPPIYDAGIAVLDRHDKYAASQPQPERLDMMESEAVRLVLDEASGR